MEIKTTLPPYLQKAQLEEEISILQRSLDAVDINQPNCPYCEEPQPLIPGHAIGIAGVRQHCSCEKMSDHLKQIRKLNDLKDQLMIAEQREVFQRKKAEKLLAESGIGRRFLTASFENFERQRMANAYDIAYSYAETFDQNDGEGLLFTGDVGTGKTHLAAATAVEIIRKYSATVEFVSYVEVLADIRAAFSHHSDDANKLEERMRKAQLLVIDDLGKEKPSQFTNEFIYRVVNGRYKDRLPMIITANIGLENLSERMDYAVFSRIVDICKVVEMRGTDYRMKDYLC